MNNSKTAMSWIKLAVVAACAALLAFALVGCGSSSSDQKSDDTKKESVEMPTESKPIVVDKEKKEIRYLAEVNDIYFTENTRHAIVYKGGSNGDKSVLTGLGDEKEFYQDMMDLGFTPGNNLTAADMSAAPGEGKSIEGDKLDVTIQWDGKDPFPIEKCFKTTNGEQRQADWRFGGNIDRAKAKNTGCVLCLDSCAVGICSDAAWESNTTTATNYTWFNGREDVLPAGGTKVVVTFKAKA
ncbi:YdjY domain-containing protein [Phoenicibacter congonensis]|uniref:YdjY domain-containing protein n=1 Tax=Phoenicibacter congonensis TaxID=1944646 RepID=UPI0018D401B4|nr:YdjY domain-containing protein [Phoenicibacter congonensis]